MLLFALVAHEVAHAWTAYRQGDDTAYKLGRITLNPLPHIDPVLTLAMPPLLWFLANGAFTFGCAKALPEVTRNFRNFVRGDLIVSSAGVVTNFILAAVCTLLFILAGVLHDLTGGSGTDTMVAAQRMLNWGIYLNLVLAVFNLIPIPPLDGGKVLSNLLPLRSGLAFDEFAGQYGFIVLYALMLTGVLSYVMRPSINLLAYILLSW